VQGSSQHPGFVTCPWQFLLETSDNSYLIYNCSTSSAGPRASSRAQLASVQSWAREDARGPAEEVECGQPKAIIGWRSRVDYLFSAFTPRA